MGPEVHHQYAVVALWEGNSLSARLRWVRFPSTAPNLFHLNILGEYAWLLTREGWFESNRWSHIKAHYTVGASPANSEVVCFYMGAVVGYGVALQASCLEGFDSLGLHQVKPY